ncbi:MAG: DsbA family protein [Candidatus Rokubacteria bacterium]|nr:DsbA family protein [Candidatus Rokubacteria bacterium]
MTAVVLLVAGAAPAGGQSPPATKEDVRALEGAVERLRGELDGIRGELRLIRDLLGQQRPAQAPPATPAVAKVSLAGAAASLGRAEAPVVLDEFSDYQCPFCKRFSDTTLALLKKDYIDTGKLRYVFRDFPLDQIHPHARQAAEASRCAGDQGRYWEMHDVIFRNQRALQAAKLKEYAERLGLDTAAFGHCLDSGKHRAAVQRDYEEGLKIGVQGTPAFVVGPPGTDDAVEGVMISGARPIADFRREIDRLLAGGKTVR